MGRTEVDETQLSEIGPAGRQVADYRPLDRRDGGVPGRAEGRQGVEEAPRREPGKNDHAAAHRERGEHGGRQPLGVIKRGECEASVRCVYAQRIGLADRAADQAELADRHGLRLRHGAGGAQQHGRVARLAAARAFGVGRSGAVHLEPAGRLAGLGYDLHDRDISLFRRQSRRGGRIDRRQERADPQIFKQVVVFRPRAGRRQRSRGRGVHHAQQGDHQIVAGRQDDRDSIAASQTEEVEPRADLVDPLGEHAIAEGRAPGGHQRRRIGLRRSPGA